MAEGMTCKLDVALSCRVVHPETFSFVKGWVRTGPKKRLKSSPRWAIVSTSELVSTRKLFATV